MLSQTHRRERGFTITELLVVIAIIGITVASASPSFVGWMKDRRVTEAAENIRDLYRVSRARAMGRGAAMYVRYDRTAPMPTDAAPFGQFVMREAISGPTNPFHQSLPLSSCTTADFTLVGTSSKHVTSFEPRAERYVPAQVEFLDWNDNTMNWAGICYTPRGRTYLQTADGGAFINMAGVPRVEVENQDDTMKRAVVIPPTGAARLVLRVQ